MKSFLTWFVGLFGYQLTDPRATTQGAGGPGEEGPPK